MPVETPHFDLPFRLTAVGVPCEEQDTFEDVANCVEAIVRTPYGFRDDSPDFGFPELTFVTQPVISHEIQESVKQQEPRADIVLEEQPDYYDQLIDRITVGIR